MWLGQTEETDSIRFNAFFIQAIFSAFYIIALLAFIVSLTGKSIIIHSKIQSIIFLLFILGVKAYLIFYKKNNKEIEKNLDITWSKNKSKNILTTSAFIVCSIIFFILSMIYVKAHPLTK